MPEPVAPVARTPKAKKAQALPNALRRQTSAPRQEDTSLSPSGLEMGQTFSSDTTKPAVAKNEPQQRPQPQDAPAKASKQRKALDKGKQKARSTNSVEYPSDTDVTYYGPEAVDEQDEGDLSLNRKDLQRSGDPGNRQLEPEEHDKQLAGPSQTRDVTTWLLTENDLQLYFICGSIKENTMLTQTDCPRELV